MSLFTFSTIGILHSCYKEKFGIPRQPRLATEALAELILNPPYNNLDALRELEKFSHIWLIFIFNQTQCSEWRSLIRPPRLGGNQRIGVFASRSMFRPNPVGLSAVELVQINHSKDKVSLLLRGCDLVDGTPIVDIKPYIPYSDSIPEAKAGFAASKPVVAFKVDFTEQAIQQCQQINAELNRQENSLAIDLQKLIVQILQLDPRPSYQSQQLGDRVYAMRLYDFDLKWKYIESGEILVLELANILM
jgi:tRNA-Thr(GGU) m(6)t(6)A37 methyltransferase TsaA